ncbi:uncharacterized protein LOC132629134 [Lycium barbarum]|uniref:uncharacterized protein LOC132629134 n=1 Tax=Lycium barbarum TaxID=112863 RepID=UPI00293EF0A5|nr:uncharacterized protein LOC132629134 [Lycium barbarum]
MGGQFPKVDWRRLTCNNHSCPKWTFILQLALMERLATKDRLLKWGIIDSATCPLCDNMDESHNHLFFECSYSMRVWTKLLKWQSITRTVRRWQEEKSWATSNASGRSVQADIYRMCLAGAVYHIWLERNARVFSQGQKEDKALVKQIIQEVFVRASMNRKIAAKLAQMNYYP